MRAGVERLDLENVWQESILPGVHTSTLTGLNACLRVYTQTNIYRVSGTQTTTTDLDPHIPKALVQMGACSYKLKGL